MDLLILFGTMVIFFAIGVPIGICLIFPCFLMLLVNPVTSASFLAQSFYTGVASSSMIALPFFMICGNIMDKGGISKRLVNAANNCIGGVTGSLGMVTILACMFFGAVSGSAVATVAAIGAIMLPEMVRNGYDKYYATGMCAVAGGLGIIVPPSYPMVVYGITNNESIGDLFIAGLAPAALVGGLLMFVNYLYCKKHGIKGNNKFHLKTALKGFWDAKWALLMPVIILGGIYSGIMTATESAVVATVYGIIIGRFVYKEVTFRQLWDEFRATATFSGGMMWTVAPATAIGLIFTYLGVNKAIAGFFLGISSNTYIVMFLIVCILFLIGMFMQTTPAIVIFSPVLLGVAEAVGVSSLQFGQVMNLALAVGFCTPPVCANVFVAQSMTGMPMDKIVKPAIPFIGVLILALLMVAFFPFLTTGVVNLLG
ncbi:TRAP transporter large permease [Intestinimonas sp.]|uniref:TRAP transporter large permease n=1 Tax=Intestinimonas sp. TaxID=1965293 RepID=UPI00262F1508|nr:TRAP transporter large permease [Intestinimonas sp.]